jgi:hypothetical protein
MALAGAPPALACDPCAGFTWYSDGGFEKAGASGTSITVYATGAARNRDYMLVAAKPLHGVIECAGDQHQLNPNPRRPNDWGVIGNTTGVLNLPVGEWQICFWNVNVLTVPATFTVL